ncbi:hypothetical protein SAMN02927895_01479 [Belnapia rosea]|nr:hypothetical protein SAMN02927895_01479 [Belnapia rosea]
MLAAALCTGRNRAEIPNEAGQPLDPQPNVSAIRPDNDPLHQRPYDPRLLSREQLAPKRVQPLQRIPNLHLGQVRCFGPRRQPCTNDYFRLPKQRPNLINHRRLDLGS